MRSILAWRSIEMMAEKVVEIRRALKAAGFFCLEFVRILRSDYDNISGIENFLFPIDRMFDLSMLDKSDLGEVMAVHWIYIAGGKVAGMSSATIVFIFRICNVKFFFHERLS